MEEIRGQARGAEVILDELFVLVAGLELYGNYAYRMCTAFAVRNGATADGLTYVGQNNDEPPNVFLNGDFNTLTKHHQSNGLVVLNYTYPGVPTEGGMNSSGLSLVANALPQEGSTEGVPMLIIMREVLNQRTLENAIEVVRSPKKAYAVNLLIGTPEGIADIEANPQGINIIRSDEILYHTNHLLGNLQKRRDRKS